MRSKTKVKGNKGKVLAEVERGSDGQRHYLVHYDRLVVPGKDGKDVVYENVTSRSPESALGTKEGD